MKSTKMIQSQEGQRSNKHRALLPFFLFAILALVLAACGSAGTGSTPTPPTTQPTATTPSQPTQGAATPAQPVATQPSSGGVKPTVPLTGIRMLDANNGWALTASSVLKTTDGGAHWQDITPANAGLNKFALGSFLNGQYAWIAIPPAQQLEGPGIVILRTSNGGASWQSSKINDPLVAFIDVPHFLNVQEGWLQASAHPGAGSAGSDIWHTTNGGQTWTKIASSPSNTLGLGHVTGISFQNAQTGIASGDLGAGGDNTTPAIAITHDGGKTWKTQILPHLLGGYTNISNLSEPPVFFGNTVILPVDVSTGSGELLVLYRSTTGGNSWTQTSVAHFHADNTYVFDSSHAWATDSQSGQFYSTSNGGDNWSATSGTAYHLDKLSFTNANTGWGITAQTLMHTTDGGKTWQQIQYSIQ